MNQNRSSGVLLHPTSLPGPDGMGDLGPEIFRWIDFLSDSGCQLWQILPLGPTGYGDSPYQCFSAFAGNPFLISSTLLLNENLLKSEDFLDRPDFSSDHIEYGPVIEWKIKLLKRSFLHFKKSKNKILHERYEHFLDTNKGWLDDFSLFMAIKETEGNASWNNWQPDLRKRDQKAIADFIENNALLISEHKYRQFLFFSQWEKVKVYTASKNIKIIGDIPIFIAYDSSDAWANPELFSLDKEGLPIVVAGVPPDYFSKTGQLWGNPLYRWDMHKNNNYKWWIKRISSVLNLVDIIRLDHFRGFEAYWEVPYGKPTAEIGRWVKGPGKALFDVIQSELGELPIIAEDLGVITEGVTALRDGFNLPGMKILQFAFADDPDDAFLPHNYPVNCFAYTGTHDNDTTWGWYQKTSERERDFCRRYLSVSGNDISWSMMRTLWRSVANYTLAPMQDLLSLGTETRMNLPGSASGNWGWRMQSQAINPDLVKRFYELNYLYGRLPTDEKKRVKALLDQQSDTVKPH